MLIHELRRAREQPSAQNQVRGERQGEKDREFWKGALRAFDRDNEAELQQRHDQISESDSSANGYFLDGQRVYQRRQQTAAHIGEAVYEANDDQSRVQIGSENGRSRPASSLRCSEQRAQKQHRAHRRADIESMSHPEHDACADRSGGREKDQIPPEQDSRRIEIIAELQGAYQDGAWKKAEQRLREGISEEQQRRGSENQKADSEDALHESTDKNDAGKREHTVL